MTFSVVIVDIRSQNIGEGNVLKDLVNSVIQLLKSLIQPSSQQTSGEVSSSPSTPQTPVSPQPKPIPVPEVQPSPTPLPQITDVELPRDPLSSQVPEKWKLDLMRFTKATKYLAELGWDRQTVITHAYHETGGFKHIIGKNNFFGITLPKEWSGNICGVITHEVYVYKLKGDEPQDSATIMATDQAKKAWPTATEYVVIPSQVGQIWVRVKLVRQFADWNSVEDAITFYANKIKSMYPQSYSFRNVPEKYFYWLVNGKYQYATNPKYVQDNLELYKVVQKNTLVKESLIA
jgi:hypothetical protein